MGPSKPIHLLSSKKSQPCYTQGGLAMPTNPIRDPLAKTPPLLFTVPHEDRDLTHQEIIKRSLFAYGMEFTCRKEAERLEAFGFQDEYSLRCRMYTQDWLQMARHYRGLAEAYEKIGSFPWAYLQHQIECQHNKDQED
jgi:hypothetical protein